MHQVVFLFLSRDPIKYRLLMVPAVFEKATYGIAIIVLFLQQRVDNMILGGGMIDLVLGVLFLTAFLKTGSNDA